jgi:hypothetical protein
MCALSVPANLLPGPTDRAAFIGQTGSGKTTLAKEILAWREWVAVYDPKGMIKWPGYLRYDHLADVERSPSARVIYAPTYAELHDVGAVDEFFCWIYEHRNRTVYVDEVYAICNLDGAGRLGYPWHYGACLTRGRERGISVFTATQRPASVPVACLSESEYFYVFRLNWDDDRKRVEQLTGIPRAVVQDLKKHQFVFAPQTDGWRGPLRVRLETAGSAASPSPTPTR